MRKLLSGNLRLHAGQFSEITIPHFLFAGADEVIFSSNTVKPPGTRGLQRLLKTLFKQDSDPDQVID